MSTISWFEIASNDIDRAQAFYETIFAISLIKMDNPAMKMRMFPVADMMNDITGAIVHHSEFYHPSASDGALVYLNANPDVQHVLNRVVTAGGKILVPKTQISPQFGYMAVIMDTEGNRVGLHSLQ